MFAIIPLKLVRCLTLASVFGLVCGGMAVTARAGDESGVRVGVRSWTTKQDLPQNTVISLLQTRDGYLWVGTRAGLSRFDGVRFRLYGPADGLPRDTINALWEARDGAIWGGTLRYGAFRWQDGQVTTLRAELSDRHVTALAETRDGTVWIGTANGLDCWHEGRLTHPGKETGLPRTYIHSVYADRAGTLWVAAHDGGIFQLHGGKFFPEPAPLNEVTANDGYGFFEDETGTLWLGIGNGVLLCKRNGVWQSRTTADGVPAQYVTGMAQTVNGTLWAGSSGDGLFYLQSNRFRPFTPDNGLADGFVLSTLADREGNLWVGTRAAGLCRLTPQQIVSLAGPQGLTNDYVRSLAETADGMLLVAADGGLYGGRQERFGKLPAKLPQMAAGVMELPESVVTTATGMEWVGGEQGLFRRETPDSPVFSKETNADWLHDDVVTALAEDTGQAVWLGTQAGQIRVRRNDRWLPVPNPPGNCSVFALEPAPDGTVWAAVYGAGILQLRGQTILTNLTTRQGLASDYVSTLRMGHDGTLWIGITGGGLSCWKDGRCRHFTARQGLPDSTVSQILEDDAGDLWLGSFHGICRLRHSDLAALQANPNTVVQPLVIGDAEGMPAEECSIGSGPNCLKSHDGRLYFSTVKGLVAVDPRRYRVVRSPPLVRLEEVVFNGKTISEAGGGKIVIPPGRGNLEFHYTGLGHPVQESIRFRYRLVGADLDWVEAGTRRIAYYSQLPPGKYRLQVIARAGEGLWPQEDASLDLVLQPHFYETWWFLILVLSLGALALALTVRYILQRRYQRQLHLIEMQTAVEKERARIAQDIHDDLGATLTQVTLLSELGQAARQPDKALQTFEGIGEKARLAVQSLDEIVWAVNPKNDNLPRLIRYICRHADECFSSSGIRCWQKVPEDFPNLAVRAEMRHNVFMAVKEALHNGLKHSRATQVWLHIWLDGDFLHIEIKDDGTGFSLPLADFNRNGLKNMKTRLAEIGGVTELESRPGQGTRVHFAVKVLPPIKTPPGHGISMP